MSLRSLLRTLPSDVEYIIWEYLKDNSDYELVINEINLMQQDFYIRFFYCNPRQRFPIIPFMRLLKMSKNK